MRDALYLHTDYAGKVWCGQYGVLAVNSEKTPHEFLRSNVFARANRVYVFNSPVNLKFLLAAYERSLAVGVNNFPLLYARVPHALSDQSPVMQLHLLSQRDVPTRTTGACNLFRRADYSAGRLRQVLAYDSFVLTNAVLQRLKEHPAYPCLALVPAVDNFAAASLFNLIGDPRWFNDPLNPHRCNQLYSFLGMTREGICSLATGNKHPAAELVVKLWFNPLMKSDGSKSSACNWLQRIYVNEKSHERGLLKASRRLVLYLRLNWLQALSGRTELAFIPERFFKSKAEVAAYRDLVVVC